VGVSGKENDRHDHYFKKARSEHYRARSVYKLKEIQAQFRLLSRGDCVVDLGAAPGSWSQYAAEVVGTSGRVVAVDRTPIEAGLPAQVTRLQLDMLEVSPEVLQTAAGVERADVVISDMAPNTSGIRSVDHARSIELCRKALQVAERLLLPKGAFVCKVFQGGDVQPLQQELRERFAQVKIFKPKSSKDESVETFLVAMGFRGAVTTSGDEATPGGGWDPLQDL